MATANIQAILDGNTHKTIPIEAYNSLKLTPPSIPTPEFDPQIHLTYYAHGNDNAQKFYNSTRRLTMKELGLTHVDQISEIGVSDPFQLFTDEAINIMRKEVLDRETFMKYARYSYNSTSGLDCVIRGFVKDNNQKDGDEIICPFIYSAWKHPKTMQLISQMAGIELEIIMDYEIAHTNISMKSENEVQEDRIKNHQDLIRQEGGSGSGSGSGFKGDDIPAVVGWHYDSYPFVCVLMLSDTTEMIGGETSLRMGNGNVAIVPSPIKGSANVLQGRLIQHIAPVPLGMSERITMVTSYRAKNAKIKDTSVLSTVKPEVNWGSRYNEFYGEWIDYRIKLMKEKLDYINAEKQSDSGNFDKIKTIEALKEVEEYLHKTYAEM